MKTLCFLLIAFIFLFPGWTSADTLDSQASPADHEYISAREMADRLEKLYGITILIGPECDNITTEGFRIGDKPSGRTPFIQLIDGYNYKYEITLIKDVLDKYPSGFFTVFAGTETPDGLRFLLADQLLYENETMAGVTIVADGYCNIFLGVGAFNRLNIHHEIWHAVEFRITDEYPNAFDNWYELNPEEFLYSEDLNSLDQWEQAAPADAFFVRGYSTIDEYEDRATIFEAMFQYDREWWEDHPYIRRKLDRMMEAAEPVFTTILTEKQKEATWTSITTTN